MKFIVLALIASSLQPGPRPQLSPAETLLEPDLLRTIQQTSIVGPAVPVIDGADKNAGEIAVVCFAPRCEAAEATMRRLKQVAAPSRTIRLSVRGASPANTTGGAPPPNTKAAIFIGGSVDNSWQIIRGPWSTAGIGDEVVEIFARYAVGTIQARPFADVGQSKWDPAGIPTTAIMLPSNSTDVDSASFIAATSAYFLATLPNAGAEALLSHLTVGAHARLAEDGRKAVAQMGNQQRASADVLIMFGQAIDREQRRMRSFERFMPEPVDPILHSRIVDMEKGITGVWTSMGITSSPFVPPAERVRGRGGEDKRVPSRTGSGPITPVEPPTAFLKFESPSLILYELGNFIDGTRSISDIRDAVSAELGALPFPSVVDYFDRLAASGAITIK